MLTMYDIQNQKYGYKLDNCPIIYSESSHTPLKIEVTRKSLDS